MPPEPNGLCIYKAQVIFGDESLFNHNRTYKVYPTVPIVVVFMIQEDNGAGHAFSGLKQGEVLEVKFDYPPSLQTIPDAVQKEGHSILKTESSEEGFFRIIVRRK